ncbi:MAG TPA: histidine phosphatase family protein [Enterococcus sp.]|nr:histidine phosphatase family protein [Enterococcus sp.]
MKTIYLVRHGQTLFNLRHKIQGWCDSPLTAEGIKQGEWVKRYFDEQNIQIEDAYASTSERACDTLELITDLPYQRVKGLKEWHFGRFEGGPEYLNPPLPYGDFFVTYGGESEIEFKERISQTIQQIVDDASAQSILIVSHGAACRQFMRQWAHTSAVDQKSPLKNGCILIFHYQNYQFRLDKIINPASEINESAH